MGNRLLFVFVGDPVPILPWVSSPLKTHHFGEWVFLLFFPSIYIIKSKFEGNGDQHFEKSPCRCGFLMLFFIQFHRTEGCKASEFDACHMSKG